MTDMTPSPNATAPTDEELRQDAVDLLAEIDEALGSDEWAVPDTGDLTSSQRSLEAAALRHLALLTSELEAAAADHLALCVVLLARAQLEAFCYALYLHFGGEEALDRVLKDTVAQLNITNEDLKAFDEWLDREKARSMEKVEKVQQANAGKARWNELNPTEPPKPMTPEPYVPLLRSLSGTPVERPDALANVKGKALPFQTVVQACSSLAREKGFGQESFDSLYSTYRLLSTAAAHPNLSMYESYLRWDAPPGFVRSAALPAHPFPIAKHRVAALYFTAFAASWILADAGSSCPVAHRLRDRLRPAASGDLAWEEAPQMPQEPAAS